MERILFERPREKLQSKGASYLSNVELLQIIIGSGNAKASAARLAKRVTTVLAGSDVSIKSLLAVDGIGVARACQIIAALELGSRSRHGLVRRSGNNRTGISRNQLCTSMSTQRQKVLLVYLFDGAMVQVSEKLYTQMNSSDISTVVRDISASVLAVGARYVTLAFGSKNAELTPDMTDLSFAKTIKEGLEALQVRLLEVWVANKDSTEEWGTV